MVILLLLNRRPDTWAMPGRLYLTGLILLCVTVVSKGQHTVDFQVPATVCKGEKLLIENDSDPGVQTQWNFCADQLEGTHAPQPFRSIGVLISGIAMAEENGQWYAFLTSENSQLVRLEFGDDPANSAYTITMLGNFGNLMVAPKGIDMVKENGTWYGLASTHAGEIVRLAWTSSLTNPPVVENLNLSATGKLNGPMAVEIAKDGDNYVAVVANSLNNRILLIDFGNTITHMPVGADIIESPILSGAANTTGITVSRQCENWYIYAIASDKIYRVDLGTSLFSSIESTEITDFSADVPITISSFNKIKAVDYKGDTYLYIVSLNGGYLAQLLWKNGATSVIYNNLGNPVVPGNPFAIDAYQHNGLVGLYVGGFNSGALSRISIAGPCHASIPFSNALEPLQVTYDEAGTYHISLSTQFADGTTCVTTKEIEVTSDVAPVPVISYDGVCSGADVQFEGIEGNEIDIISYAWSFGDTQTATGQTPTHIYSNAGTYSVRVGATAGNGCYNDAEVTVKIFAPPVAQFGVPQGILCTNNEFVFQNTTLDDFEGNLVFEWTVNGSSQSNARDLHYSFSSVGDHVIGLKAAIPGCLSEVFHTLNNIESGPAVAFSVSGKCEDEQLAFTSQVVGDASEYEWDFGNGATANAANAQQSFDAGSYTVSLDVRATNGCLTSVSEPLVVYSKPVANFVLDLPPFSCAGNPAQFHDSTPNPDDSNISSRQWIFGDGAVGFGKDPTHTYGLAGNYNVTVTVTTDQGCVDEEQRLITILPSPTLSVANAAACVNQPTPFTANGNDIKSWQWKIGTTTYTQQNPSHMFAQAGDYSVQLTATAHNNCIQTVTRQVVVPVPPVLDFSISNPCTTQPSVFSGAISGTPDVTSSVLWDFGDGTTGSGITAEHTFGKAVGFPVKMSSTHQSGCVYSVARNVQIHPLPVSSFEMSDESGPAPLKVSFTNKSAGASGYVWTFDDALGSTSTAVSPVFTFADLGSYQVGLSATSSQGCTTRSSNTIHVIVPHVDLSLVEFSLVPDATSGMAKGLLNVRNRSNYRISAFDLIMDTGSGVLFVERIEHDIASQAEATIVTKNSMSLQTGGTGYVCMTISIAGDENTGDNKRCQSTDGTSVIFEPYPNPTSGHLSLQFVLASGQVVNIEIVNSSGASAYAKTAEAATGLNLFDLDLSALSQGLYVLRVTTSSALIMTRRISIQY